MKISTGPQDPATVQQAIESRAEKTNSGAPHQKPAKAAQKGDTVELSPSLDAELKSRQAEQAKRVASIKSLVDAGKYKVSSHDVAQKMLSGRTEK